MVKPLPPRKGWNLKKRHMERITDNIASPQAKQYFDSIIDAKDDKEISELAAGSGDIPKEAKLAALQTIYANMEAVVEDAREDAFRKRLKEVPQAVSFSYIAKRYFGKSRAWLMQKVNNNTVHGTTAKFSDSELRQFKCALVDISKQLSDVAQAL